MPPRPSAYRGYALWLTWDLNWLIFNTSPLHSRQAYWMKWLHTVACYDHHCKSRQLFSDATTTFTAGVDLGPPCAISPEPSMTIGGSSAQHQQPTSFTLSTDSAVVYCWLSIGKVLMLRRSEILKQMFCRHGTSLVGAVGAAPAQSGWPSYEGYLLILSQTLAIPRKICVSSLRKMGVVTWIGHGCSFHVTPRRYRFNSRISHLHYTKCDTEKASLNKPRTRKFCI